MESTELVVGGWTAQPEQMAGPTSGVTNPESWLIEALGGAPSHSGIRVNEHTVLTSGPVYQAVNILSSGLAALPIQALRKRRGKHIIDERHPGSLVWNHLGNDEMLPYHVRQTLIAWGLIHGNGIGVIHWDLGRAVGVYPLRPGSVVLDREKDTGQLIYKVTSDNGTAYVLFPYEVFHFKTLGNGLWGHSPLGLFQNTFGNGMAIEKYQGKHFSNDATPSGVLQHPGVLKPESRANLRREWNEVHQGLDNTGKIAVLWNGMTWQAMSVSNRDAQMLEARKFYREEIASIYNLPPHMLGAMENSAVRANIEEQNRSYVRQALIPHDRAWCQETERKFCNHTERQRCLVTVKHNFKALLRGDLAARYAAYAVGRQWGWLSANDVLRLEDMDEIGTQGDVYMVPSNMADAATGKPFTRETQQTEPTKLPETGENEDNNDENRQNLLGFARKSMLRSQSVEIRNLRKAMNGKRPFDSQVQKYYSTFSAYMAEPLETLSTVSGFVGPERIQEVAEEYAATSLESLEGVTTEDDLLNVVLSWPQRIENTLGLLIED